MELGNMMFGNSKGNYPMKRGRWQDRFYMFLEDASIDTFSIPEFENDIFKLFPYYWGECTCGFEEKDDNWAETHDHDENCYQKIVDKELIERGWYIGSGGFLEHPKEINWVDANTTEEIIRKKYCKQLGLPYPDGSWVHCTCNYDKDYEVWRQTNNHQKNCPVIQPNFLYKPTGFEIRWYKYPLRDSYMNQNVSYDEYKKILKHCVESVKN